MRLAQLLILALTLVALTPPSSRAQSEPAPPDSSIDMTVEAGEADAELPPRQVATWNAFDTRITSFRFGFGFLVDFVTYVQDDESKQQLSPEDPDAGVRDFRLLFKGKFKTKRSISWTLGYMYDGVDDDWHFRQTGLYVEVPELSGRFFLGRTKEGYSLIKVMVGYHGWTHERSQSNDAFVPILNDGLKYMGYYERPRIYFTLGAYTDAISEDEKFATADHLWAARLGWLPVLADDGQEMLFVALMTRDTQPDEGKIQVRSKGGSFLGPYFLDTGKFDSDHARVNGVEAYYRKGPWLFGTEYNWETVEPLGEGDVLFHGGDAVVSWIITGETRTYNAPGAYFEAVSPRKTVFEGGFGAWEGVLHMSYSDFDSGRFQGGKYWRLTPMVNWHMSDNLRLEFIYGYGELDRFGLTGGTQFFQARIQTSL
jgi:phosphate-selective porin OprO/OprP